MSNEINNLKVNKVSNVKDIQNLYKKLPKVSGVYLITLNDIPYIGSSINIRSRVSVHFKMLRRNVHHNIKLQQTWNGTCIPKVVVLELTDNLLEREEYWTKFYNSQNIGFNINVGKQHGLAIDQGMYGKHHSNESKEKMRALKLGTHISKPRDPISEATREKMRQSAILRSDRKRSEL